MLLIGEVLRVLWNAMTLAFHTKKIGLLLIILAVGFVVAFAGSLTVVGPVAVYPFL